MVIVGHRGARLEAPENTMAGFHHLRNLNIHHVELDIRLSKDHHLMVIHDATVDRTTAHKGHVSEHHADSLANMNAAHNHSEEQKIFGIPRLDDIFRTFPHLESIQLEVKTTDKDSLELIATLLVDMINHYNIQSKAIITSSDTFLLAVIQRKYPTAKKGYVAERFSRNPIGTCQRYHCQYLVVNWHRCNAELIKQAHAANLHVSTWTVNKINVAKKLKALQVDSLITDVPSLMLTHL